jgi:predicted molibdopterin-dependent oxidoreductase YjgC
MNERIKQLEKQCWRSTQSDPYAFFDVKKFAELIVRECVAICQDVDGEDNIDARSGRQDCAVEIREHFGVEE